MGIFKRNKKEMNKGANPVPSLPELPKLPDLPEMGDENERNKNIHKLPSYPSGSLGTKFSQNTIKEAVAGRKNEFPEDDEMEDPPTNEEAQIKKPITEEIGWESPLKISRKRGFENAGPEPVFIRIDRFEEALKIFNDTKKKFHEIERALEEIKSVREKEEKELNSWENKVKTIKGQIEKVDRDVFSKI